MVPSRSRFERARGSTSWQWLAAELLLHANPVLRHKPAGWL